MCGVLTAGMAVVTSFGLLMYGGVAFVDIVSASPFLIVGKTSLVVTHIYLLVLLLKRFFNVS